MSHQRRSHPRAVHCASSVYTTRVGLSLRATAGSGITILLAVLLTALLSVPASALPGGPLMREADDETASMSSVQNTSAEKSEPEEEDLKEPEAPNPEQPSQGSGEGENKPSQDSPPEPPAEPVEPVKQKEETPQAAQEESKPATEQRGNEGKARGKDKPAAKDDADNEQQESTETDKTQDPSTAAATEEEEANKEDKEAAITSVGAYTCLNTGSLNPYVQQQASGNWTSGNLGGGYSEGDWFSIRGTMTSLKANTLNKAVFGFDRMVSGKYAFDNAQFMSLTNGASLVDFSVSGSGSTGTITVYFMMPEGETSTTLTYRAHIASEFDHGVGMGASSIGGSPYHNYATSVNCRGQGNKELPIKASDLSYALLTVKKVTNPSTTLTWPFTLSGAQQTSFSLGNNQSTTFRVPPGTWTTTETMAHAGWDLAGVTCSPIQGNASGTSVTVSLANKSSTTCTFTNERRTFADLTVTKTASPSYTHTWDWSISKSVDSDKEFGASHDFSYDVTVTPEDKGITDAVITGNITVTNPNNWPVSDVTVTDSLTGFAGAQCTVDQGTQVTVPAKGNITLDYTCTLPADSDLTASGYNKAKATWSKSSYPGSTGTAYSPNVNVDLADADVTTIGATATVSDSHYDLQPGELNAKDGAKTYTYDLPLTAQPGTCEARENTATVAPSGIEQTAKNAGKTASASATLCNQADLEVTKNVVGSLERTYGWGIAKEAAEPVLNEETNEATIAYKVLATPEDFTDAAWVMTGNITVLNPNDFTEVTATVTDAVNTGGWSGEEPQCVVVGGTDAQLDAGEERTFEYTCRFDSQPSYGGTNTATATWMHNSEEHAATGTATFEEEDWTVTAFRDQVDITDLMTIDGLIGEVQELGTVSWGDGAQAFTYEKSIPVPDGTCTTVNNDAEITQTSQQANTTTTICNQADLTVEKNIIVDLTRTFGWDITKDIVNVSEPDANGAAQIDYSVIVEELAAQDSSWNMFGEVTVGNPNDFTEVTTVVSDNINIPGVTCEVFGGIDGGNAVSIPAQGQATLPYLCDSGEATITQYDGVNTATATWLVNDQERTAQGDAEFSEQDWNINEFNKTISVYDTLVVDDAAPEQQLLGTITWTESGTTPPYTYSEELTVEPGTCSTVINTAELWSTTTETPEALAELSVGRFEVVDLEAQLLGQSQQERTLCNQQDVVAGLTVSAQLDRQYTWDIDKIAVDDLVLDAEQSSVDLPYTVVVTEGATIDSNWTASGTLTLSNPNDFTNLTSDVVINVPGGQCVVMGETPIVVAPGESVDRDFTCTFAQDPGYLDAQVSAVVTTQATQWAAQEQTDAPADMVFAVAQEVDKTVTIEDSLVEFDPVWDIEWSQEGTTHEADYSIGVGVDAGECVVVDNVAQIVQTLQGVETSTEVCRDEGGVGGVIVDRPTTPPVTNPPTTPTTPTVQPVVQPVVTRVNEGVLGVRYDLPQTGADMSAVYLATTAFLLGMFLLTVSATRRRRRE